MDTTSARSAALLSYYAALNVLGATGLFSEVSTSQHFEGQATLTRRQLFPRTYLARHGHASGATQIANSVLASPQAVMFGSPGEYYPRLAKNLAPDRLAEMNHLHALPSRWHEMEYDAFLAARRGAMSAVIREAFDRLPAVMPRKASRARAVPAKV